MVQASEEAICLDWSETVDWTGTTAEFLKSLEGLTQRQETDALYARCRCDLGLFCLTYLGKRFTSPFNRVHHALLQERREPWYERTVTVKEAEAAPRGVAKSTLESWAKVIHAVVYGLEAFVAIGAAGFALSTDLVEDLHRVFRSPEAYSDLHRDYGPIICSGPKTKFFVRAQGQGECKIMALSMGGEFRGPKSDGTRPTLIILDDAEHPKRVMSAKGREYTWSYLTKDILKAGRKGTIFRVVGTILHADSMLAKLMKSPGWKTRTWKALLSWPTDMALWAEAKLIWSNLSNDDRVVDAIAFYEAHKPEMDAGAEVVWPEEESLWDLMVLWWEDAPSFFSEKQNQPRDPARQRFDPGQFRKCRFDGSEIHQLGPSGQVVRSVPLSQCKLAAWLDPAVGKEAGKNDFWCLAFGAIDPDGWRYLLTTVMQRSRSSQQRNAVWALFEKYPETIFGVEDNGFQALFGDDFERERRERKAAGKPWRIKIKGYTSTVNKIARIDCLETPLMEHGWLQVSERTPGIVLGQFRDFPHASHDDGPDAIERMDWLLTGGSRKTLTSRNTL